VLTPTRYSLLLLALAACRDAPEPSAPPALTLSPGWTAVLEGDSTRLTATSPNAQGDTLDAATLTWSSSNPAVADVDAAGMVHGRTLGSARIGATYQGVSDSTEVAVVPPVLVGAGDIASCSFNDDEATAKLLDSIPGVVFTAGDNAYPNGAIAEYTLCYDPTWGRHKNRSRPSPGNHEYNTLGIGYYTYFGRLAGDSGVGSYSYDLGTWHIVSLNSNVSMAAGSAQEQWLRADLAAHPTTSTLAYWHHPRFSSGEHGSSTAPQPLWQALYDAGADVVINGHDHTYERFAPQTPAGTLDSARGIRAFVVGTGGAALYQFPTIAPNSEVRDNTTRGVIKLTLHPTSYEWAFVPAAGGTFRDSGTGACR